jgi:hypothetical protein
MALLLTLLYFVSTIWIFSYILSFLGLPFFTTDTDWQDGQDGLASDITLLCINYLDIFLHPFLFRTTQKIERKHLTLRTRIKRLARKTICFSKSIVMHDIVIGLFINRYEF